MTYKARCLKSLKKDDVTKVLKKHDVSSFSSVLKSTMSQMSQKARGHKGLKKHDVSSVLKSTMSQMSKKARCPKSR